MTWAPHVTVASVIERDGRFLLVHERAEGRRVYNQPAGHLEPGESLAQAAVRETHEETGYRVRPTATLGVRLYRSPHNGVTYLRTTFIAEALERDRQAELDEGIIEAVWLSYAEILERREQLRSPLTLAAIEQFRSGERYPLEVVEPDR